MSLSTDIADPAGSRRFLYSRLVVAGACVLLADFLFYGYEVGVSFAIFLVALAAVIVLVSPLTSDGRRIAAGGAALVAALAPAIETLDILSAAFAILGLALFAMLVADVDLGAWRRRLWRSVLAPLMGPRLLFLDMLRAGPLLPANASQAALLRAAKNWAVPLVLLCVFLALLAQANPLIEEALILLDPLVIWRALELLRVFFWAATLLLIWPIFHVCDLLRAPRNARAAAPALPSVSDGFLGAQPIVNALLLFNALFAAQSVLDILYLWGGVSLPHGMTYASYAHRGAYPLLATALLAAGFALVAMRPGGPAETEPLIRPLTLAFVAQNALLVISSMLRLDLYVAAYSLTLWRAAAFIWMGLVAFGLAAMLYQLLNRKPLSWLIDANTLCLLATLYAAGLIDFPYAVAAYNVAHSREIAGAGPVFDAEYAMLLGPGALPAIDDFLRRHPAGVDDATLDALRCWRKSVAQTLVGGDWRAWSFRDWRLRQYLASEGAANPPAGSEL